MKSDKWASILRRQTFCFSVLFEEVGRDFRADRDQDTCQGREGSLAVK